MANTSSSSPSRKRVDPKLKADMARLGFGEASDEIRKRLILLLCGREKQGKTHFALTAPDPIAYINFDVGEEGVIQKAKAMGKTIFHQKFRRPMTFDHSGSASATGAQEEWIRFSKTWYKLIEVPGLRTIILDTETEANELIRLARLGKLSQVKPHHYGPVNAEYDSLLKSAYDSGLNVVLIDKMKKEYKNDKWNGNYERKGFGEMGFIAQVIAQMHRYREDELEEGESWPEDSFAIRVTECRQNAALAGAEFNNAFTCNFPFLATQVYPDTDLEDWK